MRTPISIFTLLLLAAPIAIASCSSDPNKKAKQAGIDDAEAARQAQVNSIDATKDRQLEDIERSTGDLQRQAETLPPGAEQQAKAQAEVAGTRQVYDANAKARLQTANARLDEAWRKIQLAGPRATTEVHDEVNAATRLRASIGKELDAIPSVTDARWPIETKRINARLDELEERVDDLVSQANELSD
jgi:hypothetical protein